LRLATPELAEQIRNTPQVKDVQVVENKLVVDVENPDTNNPEIVRRLVQAGADIQFVGELRRSLEDVYLQLVRNAE
jgi:ABC-2 type transport system ATP-binding protein